MAETIDFTLNKINNYTNITQKKGATNYSSKNQNS